MKLYHSPGSCALAAHIILNETGVPFERVLVPLAENAQKQPAYLAINPRGILPALDYDGGVMSENAAIMTYVALRHPEAGLLPEKPAELAKCLEWVAWQSNTLQVAIASLWRTERFIEDEADYGPVKAMAQKKLERFAGEIESWLSAHSFAAGESYSIADPMFLVFYRWCLRAGVDVGEDKRPAFAAYAKRLAERPAVKAALEAEKISLFSV